MVDDPEIKRLRADRARAEAKREALAAEDAQRRADREAAEARRHLSTVDRDIFLKEQRAAEAAAERESPRKQSLAERVNRPRNERGFRKRGERERER